MWNLKSGYKNKTKIITKEIKPEMIEGTEKKIK
jgi:hypothetical protein